MKKTRHKYLNVIVPVHNEEASIAKCVHNLVKAVSRTKVTYDIILVNDCSGDRTQEEIDSLKKKYPCVRAYKRASGRGFGSAVREGMKHVNAEYYALIMADSSDDPEDFLNMIRLSQKTRPDAVFTNRFINKGWVRDYPVFKLFINRLGNWLISFLFRTKYTDLTNAFQLISAKMTKGFDFRSTGFELTVENTLNALKKGKKFGQVPVHWIGREKGVSKFEIFKIAGAYLTVIARYFFMKS